MLQGWNHVLVNSKTASAAANTLTSCSRQYSDAKLMLVECGSHCRAGVEVVCIMLSGQTARRWLACAQLKLVCVQHLTLSSGLEAYRVHVAWSMVVPAHLSWSRIAELPCGGQNVGI